MRRTSSLTSFLLLTLSAAFALCANAQVNVWTYHYDNYRTGANTNETILTPGNVNSNSFGLLYTQAVDGYVYTMPLYVANVTITNKGTHNVVYIGTENDTMYAFDADNKTGGN